MYNFVFVSDLFIEEYAGGAELTSDAIIRERNDIFKIKSTNLTKNFIDQNREKIWIFGNFAGIPEKILLYLCKSKLTYHIVEYDFKFCKLRSPQKHIELEGSCGCIKENKGKLVSIFFNNAKKIWFMSEGQYKIYKDHMPFIKEENINVLSSIFSKEHLKLFSLLNNNVEKVSDKFLILNSNSWIKGTGDGVSYAKENNLNYELVSNLTYEKMLKKIRQSKGLIFLPKAADTCPRVVIEAKLLGCELITNENVLHRDEDWFNQSRKKIFEYLSERVSVFWSELEKDLPDVEEKKKFLKEQKISFANQVYNEPEAIQDYLKSCLQFSDIIDEVYVINHRSSDNTLEVIESFKENYDKSGIKLRWKTEKRDFSKNYTIADLFGDAVKDCENEIVFRHDADFVFGNGYIDTMYMACKSLLNKSVYACGYEIPVVSEKVTFDNGKVVDYGYCTMHVSVPRVFKKSKTVCMQNHVNGKYEWFHPTERECSIWLTVPHYRESVLSINVKTEHRQELRETMNTFMEDLQSGKASGNWLESGDLRREKEEWAVKENNMKRIDISGEVYG